MKRSGKDEESFASSIGISVAELQGFVGGTSPSADHLLTISDRLGFSVDVLLRGKMRRLPAKSFKMLVLDVDGTMSDGGMYFSESGDEFKRFHAKDGRAILHLIRSAVEVAFLSSGSRTDTVMNRAKRLGVTRVHVGRDRKLEILQKWSTETGIALDEMAFIGDDMNDLEAIQSVGFSACPSDAAPAVLEAADVVLFARGGDGCVREFVDHFHGATDR